MKNLIVNSRWENFPSTGNFGFEEEVRGWKCLITVRCINESLRVFEFEAKCFRSDATATFKRISQINRPYPGCYYFEVIKEISSRINPKNRKHVTFKSRYSQLQLFN